MQFNIPTIEWVHRAEPIIRQHLSPAPLIRSYPLEKELGVSPNCRIWFKDYGWTPVGSFKLMGALNWMAAHAQKADVRPVVGHSSGNFASGLAFAGSRYSKQVIIVMPDSAPRVKFERTKSFGAQIRIYDIATDHVTGMREQMTAQIIASEEAIQASPYDDPYVIAGNGVGGLEIASELKRESRGLATFVCSVSGGGLMAGHILALEDSFPNADLIGVEPVGANDFEQSLARGERIRIEHPTSICDGLLSYDVGCHNWPILRRATAGLSLADSETRFALKWLYEQHGLQVEPSGAIAVAALLHGRVRLRAEGDIVAVISGRNVDEEAFRGWIS